MQRDQQQDNFGNSPNYWPGNEFALRTSDRRGRIQHMEDQHKSPSGWDQTTPETPANEPMPAQQMLEKDVEQENAAEMPLEQGTAKEQKKGQTKADKKARKTGPKKKIWFARHKVLTVVILALIAAFGFLLFRHFTGTATAGSSYSYVRTTTLQKTTLENSVTTTGTVASGSVASVSVTDAAKLYAVTEVDVAVGDTVNEGDVICKLNTSDLEKSITSAKQSYSDTLQAAQTSYSRALDAYNSYVVQHENNLIDLQDNIDSADSDASTASQNVKDAQSAYDSAQSTVSGYQSTINNLQSAYTQATSGITGQVTNYKQAATALNTAANDLNSAISDYNSLYENCLASNVSGSDYTDTWNSLCTAANKMLSAYYAYNNNSGTAAGSYSISQTNLVSVSAALQNSQDPTAVQNSVSSSSVKPSTSANYVPSYTQGGNAVATYNAAAQALQDAESSCVSGTGYTYDQLIAAYTQAQTALTQATTALNQATTALSTAKNSNQSADKQVTSAHNSYDTEKNYSNLKSLYQSLQDAKTKLDQAKRTPDTLTTLQTTLGNCTLTATMSGTVTALNATVGSVISGTAATIQDTNGLTVDITIPADKVTTVTTGMTCSITSDSTGDETISGKLTQIDPVANDSGTFGATVTVTGDTTDLLIGMQAQVDIIESSTDNVFVVPSDAVATAEDGSSYVYRKTGGEGVNMTFEQVTVTTGTSNDYYIEISGNDLAEGDIIRSSADLTEGIETSDSTSSSSAMMMGGGDMSGGPQGGSGGGDMGGGPQSGGSGGSGGGGAAPGGGM